ncbi:MAG TPA: polysaccharide ABC transporter ATP-binding protein [Solirubrobacterales bacterium]|nr:polysaccharide ABC transporter ATP-binding protein [Solirubrobacterales bacterium]
MRPGTAIEVRDLRKSFAVPSSDSRTLADRLKGPVRRGVRGGLPVLDGITFDIETGEFFGIVGKNGSGKSTLIRILANIYGVDSGTVDVRGKVAPVVELGVGFNTELSARANVVLGGVTLGLDRRSIEGRVDEVLEYAGVAGFAEMPLRNFSTGMRTRLAFAVSIEADPDILLLDEALAVGDSDFQERCLNELERRRDAGKTIVLVSHSIGKIRQYCDRAMLLVDGEIDAIGDPDTVGLAYHAHQTNANRQAHRAAGATDGAEVESVEVVGADESGSVPQTGRLEVEVVLKMLAERPRAGARVELRSGDGTVLFTVSDIGPEGEALRPGDRVRVRVSAENPVTPAEYQLGVRALATGPKGNPYTDSQVEWTFISIEGHGSREGGVIEVDSDFEFDVTPGGAAGLNGSSASATDASRDREVGAR